MSRILRARTSRIFSTTSKRFAHEGQEIFPMQADGFRLLQGLNRGGAGFAVEEGEFAQKVSRPEDGQDQFLPGRGRDRDFHPAAFDEVEGATFVAHVEERLTAGVPPPDEAFFEGFEFGRPEAGEQRDLVPQFCQRHGPRSRTEEWACKKRTIAFRGGQFRRRIFHTPVVKCFIPGSRANVVRWPGRNPEEERGRR